MPGPSFALTEVACALVLAFALAMMLRSGLRAGSKYGTPRSTLSVLGDILLIAVSAWVGEVSCIRLYGFYQYDPRWSLFADRMPLMVALIWPVVILSARELHGQLRSANQRPFAQRTESGAIGVALVVLYDASLVEPIAVASGLWSWNEPGLFGVPLIGILGWAYFAGAVVFLLHWLRGPAKVLVVVLAPLITHALLVVTWWGALRWILRGPVAPTAAAVLSAIVALVLAIAARRNRHHVGLDVMISRMAAAGFFFALLALYGAVVPSLVAYAIAFAPPYLLATRWSFGSERVGLLDRLPG